MHLVLLLLFLRVVEEEKVGFNGLLGRLDFGEKLVVVSLSESVNSPLRLTA